MRRLRSAWKRLIGTVAQRGSDDELAIELEAHVQMLADDNQRRGMAPAEARRAAVLQFGNPSATKEACRDHRGFPWIETFFKDLRFALRSLRKSPGYTIASVCTLALGIGANSAIFSLANGLIFRPLQVPNASQIVTLRSRTPSGMFGDMSWPDYTDFRDKAQSFAGLIAYELMPCGFAAEPQAQSQVKYGFLVSGNFFRVLGTEPQLGRGFKPEEGEVPGRDAVVCWDTISGKANSPEIGQ